ncbi:MAG: thioredoxin family protein [Planctomycetes bacterium]|nr:thioredoxin family protein [Planctomycetota bacterium]
MALTESRMLPLGTKAPPFALPEPLTGKTVRLQDVAKGKATVVMFLCNHCPYVKHVQKGLVKLASEYLAKGVAFVAISANDAKAYPDDAPARMAEEARVHGYRFPYLYDETQEVAKAYQAACTPDFYVFDAGLRLVYRGQMDGSRPGNGIPVTGQDLRTALDAVLAGQPVNQDQRPSAGCNIKWQPAR